MSLNDLSQRLRERFSVPTLDAPNLVFWYDPEGQYQEEVENLQLDNVAVVTWHEHNSFALKRQLNAVSSGNFLIYARHCPPLQRADHSCDLLLDLELGHRSFQADLYSAWLEELGLATSEALCSFVKEHIRFFKEPQNRQDLAVYLRDPRLRERASREIDFLAYLALAVRCKVQSLQNRALEIAVQVLGQGTAPDSNKLWKEMHHDGWQPVFWRLMAARYGYSEDEPTLAAWACHVLRVAAWHQVPSLAVGRAKPEDNLGEYCVELSLAWHRHHAEAFGQFVLEMAAQESNLWNWSELPDNELLDSTIWPTADAEVLRRHYQEICEDALLPKLWETTITKRKPSLWFAAYRPFYDLLALAADLYRFRLEHEQGFHESKASKLWKLYCQEYCVIDTKYRRFQQCWEQVQTCADLPEGGVLIDLATDVRERINNLYANWFLTELSENWTNIAAEELRLTGTVEGIDCQTSFFSRWGARNPGEKSVVIISDGLRYEVAKELAQTLSQLDPCVNCKLESCCAAFPSITKMGMAALLPHRRLTLTKSQDGFEVLADGKSTASTYRQAVLQERTTNSLVLKYKEVINCKGEALRERLKGKELVYIYHDIIDEYGHIDQISGVGTKVIRDLSALIKRLNSANVRHLVITADHGFLYSEQPLRQADKLGCDCRAQALENGARYLVLPAKIEPPQLTEVRLLDGDTPYRAWATKELVRLKIQGQGGNYIHGGISLQELAVPVLIYGRVRSDSKAYANNPEGFEKRPVKVRLSSEVFPITNRIFQLKFFQEEPVGNAIQPQAYVVWLTDYEGRPVCNPGTFLAEYTSNEPADRVCKVRLSLYSRDFSDATKSYTVWLAPAKEEPNILQGKVIPSAVKCADFKIQLAYSNLEDF